MGGPNVRRRQPTPQWKTWVEVEILRQANLTLIRQPQLYLTNLYMEGEGELVDEEFQESEFINEEFKHEDVEDPSQGFMDWDSPPAYDDDINEVDSNERPLSSDLEEEYKEDGSSLMFDGLYPEEDDPLEEEEPMDDIVDYEEGMKTFQVKCLILVMKN